MHPDSPYPANGRTVGILNLAQTLWPATAGAHGASSFNLPPLSFLLLADRLGELYEMTFPTRPEWLDEEVVDWRGEEDVLLTVERFLGRVNTLFPVYEDMWDADLEIAEWRLYEIPIMPEGYDLWCDSWDDLKEPAAYLLHLGHSRGDEEHPSRPDGFTARYPDHQLPRALEPYRLVESLRDLAMPYPELKALPDLILMLGQDTGNVWLDTGPCELAEGGGYPEWSRAMVTALAEEWQKAQAVLEGVMSLLDWKNQNPAEIAEKLVAVRDVLLEAYERMPSHEPTSAAHPAPPA
ncbi:MAG: hypothetical protein L0332_18025 [Chloroflexi bacterium]|nr:hypothetical protein [Chloroflexota bacterium]MCI0728599.1 hypothetical protein [Chloroflexota bacterium]